MKTHKRLGASGIGAFITGPITVIMQDVAGMLKSIQVPHLPSTILELLSSTWLQSQKGSFFFFFYQPMPPIAPLGNLFQRGHLALAWQFSGVETGPGAGQGSVGGQRGQQSQLRTHAPASACLPARVGAASSGDPERPRRAQPMA